jgi:predicted DNA-binding transcriptional regulator AlpA
MSLMRTLSTNQAARKLGIGVKTLSRYIALGKVPPPAILKAGETSLHSWTEEEIERVRMLLPKIANGRKTRHRKEPKPKQTKPKKK